jgi:hypothetical protein
MTKQASARDLARSLVVSVFPVPGHGSGAAPPARVGQQTQDTHELLAVRMEDERRDHQQKGRRSSDQRSTLNHMYTLTHGTAVAAPSKHWANWIDQVLIMHTAAHQPDRRARRRA